MEITQAIVLALVQGITEFLPISSSAHLILPQRFTDWSDQGLAFDVAMNTATWLAVVIYLRDDILRLVAGFFASIFRRNQSRATGADIDARLAWMLLVATVPVAVAGVLAHDIVAGSLRSIEVIAISSIVWGVVLWAADRRVGMREIKSMGWSAAIFVGLAQAVALIPGTSRSGITITAGLFSGLTRPAAARFSFLLAVVVGALAGAKEGVDMITSTAETPWLAVGVGFAVAFVSAYLTIHYFLKFISRASMTPFVAYRVLLGVALLAVAWLGA